MNWPLLVLAIVFFAAGEETMGLFFFILAWAWGD